MIFYILPGGDAECCARNGRTLELACADHYSISRETSCIPTRYKLLFGSFTTSVTAKCPQCPRQCQPDSFQGPLFPGCYYTAPWIPNCVIQCDEACSDAHSQHSPVPASHRCKNDAKIWMGEREKQCGPLIRSTDIQRRQIRMVCCWEKFLPAFA